MPDTGSLHDDLHGILDQFADRLDEPGTRRSFAALLAAMQVEPGLSAAAHDRWCQEREYLAVVVRRAAERGEVAALRATSEVIEQLLAPLVLRALVTGGELDADLRQRCVDLALVWARGA